MISNFDIIQSLKTVFQVFETDFQGKEFSSSHIMMGVSARNRLFSKSLIKNFVRFSETLDCNAHFVIYDVPYAFNDAADDNRAKPTEDEYNKARHQGLERTSMVKNCVSHSKKNFTIRTFEDFNEDVRDYKKELREAIKIDKTLYTSLAASSKSNLVSNGKVWNENFLNFQLEEIPTSIYLYYKLNWLVDVYPGKNIQFFKQLESGVFTDSLPRASALARNKSLCFINVEHASGVGSRRS